MVSSFLSESAADERQQGHVAGPVHGATQAVLVLGLEVAAHPGEELALPGDHAPQHLRVLVVDQVPDLERLAALLGALDRQVVVGPTVGPALGLVERPGQPGTFLLP